MKYATRVALALVLLAIPPLALAIDAAVVPLQQTPATNTTQNYTVTGFGTLQCANIDDPGHVKP